MFKVIKLQLFYIKRFIKNLYTYPVNTLLENSNVDYDKYWKDKRGKNIGGLSDWQEIRAKIIVEKIKDDKNISILDVGCGDGSVLNYIDKNVDLAKKVGLDVSSFSLKKAAIFGIEIINTSISCSEDINNLPEVDYMLFLEVLEHMPNSEEILNSAMKKVQKGCFFSIPNTGYFSHRLRLLFGRFPLQWRLNPGEHLRFWTKKDIIWWLKALGYRNYRIFYYKGVPFINKIWPSLFAAGIVVYIKKSN